MSKVPEHISKLLLETAVIAAQDNIEWEIRLDGLVTTVRFPGLRNTVMVVPSWANYSEPLGVQLEDYTYLQLFVALPVDSSILMEENLASIPYSFGQNPSVHGNLEFGLRHHIEVDQKRLSGDSRSNEVLNHCMRMAVHADLFE